MLAGRARGGRPACRLDHGVRAAMTGGVTGCGMPVLAVGDEIRLAGRQRVAALDGTSVRLVDVAGLVTVMLVGHLLADPGLQLLTGHGRPLSSAGLADRLPGEVRASAQW